MSKTKPPQWRLQDTANVGLGVLIGILWKAERSPEVVEIMVLLSCATAFIWTVVWFIAFPARDWWRERAERRRSVSFKAEVDRRAAIGWYQQAPGSDDKVAPPPGLTIIVRPDKPK